MRRLLLATFIAVVAQGAHAADPADMPILRGSFRDAPPPQTYRTVWQGVYAGGQVGYGVVDSDFTNATQDITARMLHNLSIEQTYRISEWPLMSPQSNHSKAFGGFVGYNAQFENVVVGVEASYMHGSFNTSASGSMSRTLDAGGYTYGVTSASTASVTINDFGSLRVRGGYTWDNALPYAFLGLGLGRGSFHKTTNVYGVAVNPSAAAGFQNIPFDYFAAEAKNDRLIYGLSAGLGLDYMLFSGLFLRAEFEVTRFSAPIDTMVSTGRVGLGYKF
jgi:opacity protein-like surface antigen